MYPITFIVRLVLALNISLPIVVALFGICIGSFLNVCIFRIPLKEDIVKLPSHCMSCGRRLKWYELIPVFSFLFQGGKCRTCGTKLSVQYPLVELLNGLLYVYVFYLYGFTDRAYIYALLISVLIVISFIDFKTYEIPIGCNALILVLGIMQIISDRNNVINYLIGFFAVSIILLIIWVISKGRAIGGGDVKLLAAAGLLLGWQKILLAFVLGCVLGAVIHLLRMKFKDADRRLAFGPYLSMGIAIAALHGDALILGYLKYLGV